MRLLAAVIIWTSLSALLAVLVLAWMAIRYANDSTCASLASTCAFENSELLRFAMIGIPAAWVAGLAVILVWRMRSRSGPKSN